MRIFQTLIRPPCYWWCLYMKSCPCGVATSCSSSKQWLHVCVTNVCYVPILKNCTRPVNICYRDL